jgi:hypothetical protein
MSKKVPLDAPWDAARAREWDRQTFAAWAKSQLGDDPAGDSTGGAVELGGRYPGNNRSSNGSV